MLRVANPLYVFTTLWVCLPKIPDKWKGKTIEYTNTGMDMQQWLQIVGFYDRRLNRGVRADNLIVLIAI